MRFRKIYNMSSAVYRGEGGCGGGLWVVVVVVVVYLC